jgi:ribosomal protein L37AE/L43A
LFLPSYFLVRRKLRRQRELLLWQIKNKCLPALFPTEPLALAEVVRLANKEQNLHGEQERKVRRLHVHTESMHTVSKVSFVAPLNVGAMTRRNNRLSAAISASGRRLHHYKFNLRLRSKSKTNPNFALITATEQFTTKTCPKCGRVNHNVGGAKIFRCSFSDCGYFGPRDADASVKVNVVQVELMRFNLHDDVDLVAAFMSDDLSSTSSTSVTYAIHLVTHLKRKKKKINNNNKKIKFETRKRA